MYKLRELEIQISMILPSMRTKNVFISINGWEEKASLGTAAWLLHRDKSREKDDDKVENELSGESSYLNFFSRSLEIMSKLGLVVIGN